MLIEKMKKFKRFQNIDSLISESYTALLVLTIYLKVEVKRNLPV